MQDLQSICTAAVPIGAGAGGTGDSELKMMMSRRMRQASTGKMIVTKKRKWRNKIKVRVSKGDYQKLRGEDSLEIHGACHHQPTPCSSHPIIATEFSSLCRHLV